MGGFPASDSGRLIPLPASDSGHLIPINTRLEEAGLGIFPKLGKISILY